ncbi:MAG: toprim domain-containing protein [Minisyncoccia bacterium]
MNPIDILTQYFRDFPGIGERQAKRFSYYLLTKDAIFLENLAQSITTLKEGIAECILCHRFFAHTINQPDSVCDICKDPKADNTQIIVVEKDADLEMIRRSKTYNGLYFVLGGVVPVLEKNPEQRVRIRQLMQRIDGLTGTVNEIIIAMSLTPVGEHTDEYIRIALKPVTEKNNIKISSLGRGLSTGLELEYSDTATLKSALGNRK